MASDPVREERIALLEHHSSQMQAYKIYAFSLIAGFFGVAQLVSALRLTPQVATTLVWLAIGFVAGGLFFCLGRFMWYGAMVSQTIIASLVIDPKSDRPPMYQLENCIGGNVQAVFKGESPVGRKTNSLARWLIGLGYNRLGLLAWSFGILIAVIAIRLAMILASCICSA